MNKQHKPYDQHTKVLIDRYPEDIVKFFAGIDKAEITLLDRELNLPTKSVDGIFNINNEYILNIEFQTRYDETLNFRMLRYFTLLREKYNLPVRSMVVYFTNNPNITNQVNYDFQNTRLNFGFELIKIWEIPKDKILNSNLPGLYPFLPLTGKDENLITVARDRIINIGLSEPETKDLLSCLATLSGIIFNKGVIKQMLTYENLVKDSSFVQGIAVETVQGVINNILQSKFGNVPDDIIKKIQKIEDLEIVNSLVIQIANATSINQVSEIIDKL